MSIDKDVRERRAIFLFYRDYEADKFVKYDRYLKRILRPIYNKLHSKQKKTGFRVSFEALARSLADIGYKVYVNDYSSAEKYSSYPVGVVGFPMILQDWPLKNPSLLGPSLYDHPGLCPDLFANPAFKKYLVLGDWTYDMFGPLYGWQRCVKWFAGIDTSDWVDTSTMPKDVDFLIYDKIRWDRHVLVPRLLQPITALLEQKGYSYNLIRYKMHDHETYKSALRSAKSMIFLCEHETQGIAYQEALASGLPVYAWDAGFWADPLWKAFSTDLIAASSVPFFSDACGMRFKDFGDFNRGIDQFVGRVDAFRPRDFVREKLSLQQSAAIYAEAYFSLAAADESARRDT